MAVLGHTTRRQRQVFSGQINPDVYNTMQPLIAGSSRDDVAKSYMVGVLGMADKIMRHDLPVGPVGAPNPGLNVNASVEQLNPPYNLRFSAFARLGMHSIEDKLPTRERQLLHNKRWHTPDNKTIMARFYQDWSKLFDTTGNERRINHGNDRRAFHLKFRDSQVRDIPVYNRTPDTLLTFGARPMPMQYGEGKIQDNMRGVKTAICLAQVQTLAYMPRSFCTLLVPSGVTYYDLKVRVDYETPPALYARGQQVSYEDNAVLVDEYKENFNLNANPGTPAHYVAAQKRVVELQAKIHILYAHQAQIYTDAIQEITAC